MSKRVLIADDSMLMRKMVADCLGDAGWEIVAEATNGQEAADMYTKHRPDVCTLDIVMPEYDGLYALRKIVEADASAKVVMVSALNQTQKIAEAIRCGAYDFIAKPFLPEQLLETVERCTDAVEVAVV